MSLTSRLKTAFRGDVPLADLPREMVRRKRAANMRTVERTQVDAIAKTPAKLTSRFAALSGEDLLAHFRERETKLFTAELVSEDLIAEFPAETSAILTSANAIAEDHSWELAGFGVLRFENEDLWRCDPIGGADWGLDYHADVVTYGEQGADIRVLWELNRFGHALTLAQAYVLTGIDLYADTLFSQIDDWMRQNPYGRGANWNCAMEVALRAINLLAAFELVRTSRALTAERLASMLQLFDQHGKFIRDNNEFSYVATSNHYLSDVNGLFWLGTLLPELENASEWTRFGLIEMLREMDKQVLDDGAHFEASTGYHKFVTEMFLYSFLLSQRNNIEIGEQYWNKLRKMLAYLQGIVRPDGGLPLIGDADGSRIVPLVKRDADDVQYLLAVGAAVFNELIERPGSPEVLWLFGREGSGSFNTAENTVASAAFQNAGSYVHRDGELYLHFNANDCGLNGRGSHAHNDALSIEVSAYGVPFIVDPGSYVYNLDREDRNKFRSTSYHSTVMVDGMEQNSIDENTPFLIGNEADPRVLSWGSSAEEDHVVAEHYGYQRLLHPVTHRRSVTFNKTERYWLIEDRLEGEGKHGTCFMFHIAPDIEISEADEKTTCLSAVGDRCLYIIAVGISAQPTKMPAFVSHNYGHRQGSTILLWRHMAEIPFTAKFVLVPSGPNDDPDLRLKFATQLAGDLNI